MKTFVSRKNLTLIHLFTREAASRAYMAETLHQSMVLLSVPILLRELDEPLAECVIEGPLLRPGEVAGLLDEVFIGT